MKLKRTIILTIYHNPRCRKSRAGLQYLQDKGLEVKIVNYIRNPVSEAELTDILIKMNKKPKDIIRTQEAIYKSNFKGKNFTDYEWIKILIENPKLIQRPIVVKGYKAILAQPPEEVDKLI
ncbi:MAG: arsenate reductase (glutaredoxin) [Bacteroidetes bacterium]|nr:arsenate reductase (glutaredoxin) [Bacteroidota bacterium]MCK4288052.1 arsenate reductase (glutaredoxin) [Bacteroidales bacterium]MCK4360761.1 arsenate reductase (glutaredoxin) [Bacteroidales bacterium]MCK4408186.1 arsenate reductase (glutaredoxin) [Bacteroidales bacterium]MCK4638362.1 arsenate reductase (glutaredoxin) [Bacteroidales bacterium]